MFRREAAWMPLLCLLAFGCAGRSSTDLLEARLRERETRIADLQADLQRTREELKIARRELHLLERQRRTEDASAPLPEQLDRLARLEQVALSTLISGGLDRDGLPGDEGIVLLLTPLDSDGDLVKVPGQIEIEALELSRPADQQRIGRWTFGTDESRELWHRGFFAAGYLLELPWQTAPRSSEVLIHARFTTVDGRQFDTSRTFPIVPPEQPPQRLVETPDDEAATELR